MAQVDPEYLTANSQFFVGSHYVGPRYDYPYDQNVKVTINRAPTDESIKLFDQLQQRAEQRVIDSVRIENNTFNAVVHIDYDCLNDQTVFRAIFDLNGKRMTAEAYSHHRTTRLVQPGHIARLRDAIAAKIAEQIVIEGIKQHV